MNFTQIFMKNHLWNKVLITARYCSNKSQNPSINVQGLSNKVFARPIKPVDPGAKKTGGYNVPEYFSFDKYSFYEAELELVKYRQPQPSSKQGN
ncbi:hypothetical protein O3M35_003890 [Rhynocoris fuscipes]|uniref:NADH-ubiquinone oxidoreductase 9 kDa subunit n=1 Tax=Rhynocoris fuscipes TaxID=488301 RepID=A0AAW1CKH8_9HEMI